MPILTITRIAQQSEVTRAVVDVVISRSVMGEPGPQGPQGDQGFAGATGATGPQGPAGPQGSEGLMGPGGPAGATGATGSQGVKGDKGDTGNTGATGATGAQGAQGLKGDKGDQGDVGPQGPQGIQGIEGAQGATGSTGSQGIQGEQGPQGIQGEQGLQGIQGEQGLQGIQGEQGLQGDDGPAGPSGAFGGASFAYEFLTNTVDSNPGSGNLKFNNATLASATEMYISWIDATATDVSSFLETIDDSTSAIKGHFKIYETADPANSSFFAIIGAHYYHDNYFEVPIALVSGTGVFTDTMPIVTTFARTGDVGDTGPQGPAGADGATGPQGVEGPQGIQGEQGVPGDIGPSGPQGAQGVQGDQGIQGEQGIQGPAGLQGADGADGADALWNFTGAYGAGTAYAVGDLATYAGQTWYRIDAHGGNVGDTPAESAYWTLIAAEGVDGADGTDGAAGADGTDGAPGAGVAAGGTTGQVLLKASDTDYDTEWGASGSSLPEQMGNGGKILYTDGLTAAWGPQLVEPLDAPLNAVPLLYDPPVELQAATMPSEIAEIATGVNDTVIVSHGTVTDGTYTEVVSKTFTISAATYSSISSVADGVQDVAFSGFTWDSAGDGRLVVGIDHAMYPKQSNQQIKVTGGTALADIGFTDTQTADALPRLWIAAMDTNIPAVNSLNERVQWLEVFGSSQINLDTLYTKAEVDALLVAQRTALMKKRVAGTWYPCGNSGPMGTGTTTAGVANAYRVDRCAAGTKIGGVSFETTATTATSGSVWEAYVAKGHATLGDRPGVIVGYLGTFTVPTGVAATWIEFSTTNATYGTCTEYEVPAGEDGDYWIVLMLRSGTSPTLRMMIGNTTVSAGMDGVGSATPSTMGRAAYQDTSFGSTFATSAAITLGTSAWNWAATTTANNTAPRLAVRAN